MYKGYQHMADTSLINIYTRSALQDKICLQSPGAMKFQTAVVIG